MHDDLDGHDHDGLQGSQGTCQKACQAPCPAPDSPDAGEAAREAALARALAAEACRQTDPQARILLAGRAGSGRTCLARALAGPGAAIAENASSRPLGALAQAGRQGTSDGLESLAGMLLLDAKGFGGARDHEACARRMLDLAEGADAVLLCIPAPDRAWGLEARFLADLASIFPETVLFCAGTKIDLLPPARVWQPGLLRPDRPESPKELAIARWRHALQAFLARNWQGFAQARLCLVSQGAGGGESRGRGESREPREGAFGIEALKALLAAQAPALVRRRLAMAPADDPAGRRAQAERLVWKSAAAATAAAAVPIPFAEAAFLAPLQIGMCASLARLYGQDLARGTAARMLAPALAGFIGRIGLVSLLDFVPGPGSLAGSLLAAGIAGPATLAVGEAFTECLERGHVQPGCAEMARLVRERYSKALLRKGELLKDGPLKKAREAAGQAGQSGRQRQAKGSPEPEAGREAGRGGQP